MENTDEKKLNRLRLEIGRIEVKISDLQKTLEGLKLALKLLTEDEILIREIP